MNMKYLIFELIGAAIAGVVSEATVKGLKAADKKLCSGDSETNEDQDNTENETKS